MGNSLVRILTFLAVAALGVGFAPAQAHAQTDVAASIYGSFSGTTNGNNTIQSPANQAGGMFELRHIANPILGFEATYSFNRANEQYSNPIETCPSSSIGCRSIESVSANAHEITVDWVPSLHIANLRPFGVLGLGLLLNLPASSQTTITSYGCPSCGTVTTTTTPTQTSTKAVYVYGAGLDWGLLPHIGLRLQYRGNLYQAPNLTKTFTSTSTFLHTSEPMLGAYVRF
ncbi:MAG TPA: outer membrane beta-barrel protein [Acidobacteriaceae bacterium]